MQLATHAKAWRPPDATDERTPSAMQRSNPPLVETLRAAAPARPAGGTAVQPATRQKLLAFASLLALMLFFTLASPNFMQADNSGRDPAGDGGQRRARDRLHLRHHHRRHRSLGGHADDVLLGDGRRRSHLLGHALRVGRAGGSRLRGPLRLRLRLPDRQAQGAALHRRPWA